ncbi:hypothetical protein B0J17DRAFT_632432 [Rhizoctonia solani]|nr:hypothetical protein B0J17DRAFT_632432 [Rhizoctonia solani]
MSVVPGQSLSLVCLGGGSLGNIAYLPHGLFEGVESKRHNDRVQPSRGVSFAREYGQGFLLPVDSELVVQKASGVTASNRLGSGVSSRQYAVGILQEKNTAAMSA